MTAKCIRELAKAVRQIEYAEDRWGSKGNEAWLIEESTVRAAGSYEHCRGYLKPGMVILTREEIKAKERESYGLEAS